MKYQIQWRAMSTGYDWVDSGYPMACPVKADAKRKHAEVTNRGYARGNPELAADYRVVEVNE